MGKHISSGISYIYTHRSLIFEVHFQELEVSFVKNKGLPRLFLAQCGQMTYDDIENSLYYKKVEEFL